jgi:pimeloyl-ACP methyl ester carboxylesterase
MKLKGSVFAGLALVVAGFAIGAFALVSGAFEIPLAELERRYATANSKFMDVDGVRVHYMDQGSGPPVVLLHASYMSLRTWDSLAEKLAAKHRVVRLDRLGAGLTGPDPKGRYSIEHEVELVLRLADALGLERFALLGTSSGGIVAFRLAAQHPERVARLVLVNSAGMPRTAATDPNRPRGSALERWFTSYYRSRAFWQENLERQLTSGVAPPPAFVDTVYDMNRRKGGREESRQYTASFRTGDPQTVLASVRAPTLILWGIGNITVSHLEADVFEHWLTNAPSMIKKYPKVGHYLYLETPDAFATDVAAFLSGGLDGDLRRTQRMLSTHSVFPPKFAKYRI